MLGIGRRFRLRRCGRLREAPVGSTPRLAENRSGCRERWRDLPELEGGDPRTYAHSPVHATKARRFTPRRLRLRRPKRAVATILTAAQGVGAPSIRWEHSAAMIMALDVGSKRIGTQSPIQRELRAPVGTWSSAATNANLRRSCRILRFLRR
jgi:hypothetical protein